jgi:hypothetical protein
MEADRQTIQGRCFNEVIELHRFIQSWLWASIPKTHDLFSRFTNALDDQFQIIHPDGTVSSYTEICDDVWSMHGREAPSFSMEIRNLHLRFSIPQHSLVTYEEWQHGPKTNARVSTAFLQESEQDGRIKWIHLHETWLPENEPKMASQVTAQ